jgi:hypothetical protein
LEHAQGWLEDDPNDFFGPVSSGLRWLAFLTAFSLRPSPPQVHLGCDLSLQNKQANLRQGAHTLLEFVHII